MTTHVSFLLSLPWPSHGAKSKTPPLFKNLWQSRILIFLCRVVLKTKSNGESGQVGFSNTIRRRGRVAIPPHRWGCSGCVELLVVAVKSRIFAGWDPHKHQLLTPNAPLTGESPGLRIFEPLKSPLSLPLTGSQLGRHARTARPPRD